MSETTVAIRGKLVKEGSKDIELAVYSFHVGIPSPCGVIENGVNWGYIEGSISSVEHAFQIEAAKHPEYRVKEHLTFTASEPRTSINEFRALKIDSKTARPFEDGYWQLINTYRPIPGWTVQVGRQHAGEHIFAMIIDPDQIVNFFDTFDDPHTFWDRLWRQYQRYGDRHASK